MPVTLVERIVQKVVETEGLYHRLVLVVGPPRSGKTATLREVSTARDWPLFNVNLRLSEALLQLTVRQRAVRAPRILADVTADGPRVVLLDNIELLFSTGLSQDPLRLLQGLSRNRTIVATWAGTYDGIYLTYAEPGHPESQRYTRPEAVIVPVEESLSTKAHGSPDGHRETQETA